MSGRRIKGAERGVRRLPAAPPPAEWRPDRDLDSMTTGERRRRVEAIRNEAAAEFGIDPTDTAAVEAAIERDAEQAQRELAAALGTSPDDEAGTCLAAAARADALGDHELAARWRYLATSASGPATGSPTENKGNRPRGGHKP